MEIKYPETPKGKRSIRQNIYGNVVGYVSGKRFWEFGCDKTTAKYWAEGNPLNRSYCECWLD